MQLVDFETSCILLNVLVPIVVPNSLDLGMVENDNNNEILTFKAAKLNNCNGDLTKRWYIEFWAWSKSEDKLKRKRLTTVNQFKTVNERESYAFRVIKEINKLLENGYYFDELKVEKQKTIDELTKVKGHISVDKYLKKAVSDNRNKYNGSTYLDKKSEVNKFCRWIKSNRLTYLGVEDLEQKHCAAYQKFLITCVPWQCATENCLLYSIGGIANLKRRNHLIVFPTIFET